jgi:hypothetical protein
MSRCGRRQRAGTLFGYPVAFNRLYVGLEPGR